MSRHKKSEETSKNDGRKYNKRLAPKPISTTDKTVKKMQIIFKENQFVSLIPF